MKKLIFPLVIIALACCCRAPRPAYVGDVFVVNHGFALALRPETAAAFGLKNGDPIPDSLCAAVIAADRTARLRKPAPPKKRPR